MTKEEALEVIEKAEQKLSLFRSSTIPDIPDENPKEEFMRSMERVGWTEESLSQEIDSLFEVNKILIPDSEDWKRLQRIGLKMKMIKRILKSL